MKKVLLVAVAIILMASAVNALPAQGYIGLFVGPSTNVPAQTVPSYLCNCIWNGSISTTYVWTWLLPSVNGLRAAEYMLVPPDEEATLVVFGAATQNPLISVAIGDQWAGVAVTFSACQMDWVWSYYMRARLYDDVPSAITIVANPSSNKFQFASCATGYPKEDITRFSYFMFNQDCVYATKDATWGAIKSLF